MSLEDFRRFDHLYEGPEEKNHHAFCPMAQKPQSTLCMCRQLDKADRMVAAEMRYEGRLDK